MKKKKNRAIALLALLCLFATQNAFTQDQFTLSGYVKDATNGEALIGATVFIEGASTGTSANLYGFYSISLPKGNYKVHYKYIGYSDELRSIELSEDIRLDIEVNLASSQLEEVVVSSKALDQNVSSIEMSVAELDIKSIEKMPAFAGEVDIIKGIQMLPGVSTVGEGASGFNVRGGGVGQNLLLLDEAPVYQSSHLFGFFSVFNPDAVKDVKLYKGGIPANYGGRLSSILDIRMKEGNNKKYEVSGGIGTIFSRIAVEGPIKKDKSSFIIAARRSYADVIAKTFTNALEDDMGLHFYDLTAKTNFNINKKNTVFLSAYTGRDVFKFDKYQGFNWGNRTATLRWNHLFSNKLFSNFTTFYSKYDYGFNLGDSPEDNLSWNSDIETYNFKPEFSYFVNSKNELNFGGEAILYQLNPAQTISSSNGETTDLSLDTRKALEAAVYLSNSHKVSESLTLKYGLRYSYFNYMGGTIYNYEETTPGIPKELISTEKKGTWESISNFGNLEPRFSFNYKLSESASIKGSYNRMNQYIHLISNTTASIPIDIWQPSTNNIGPQQGDQVALGYFKNFDKNNYEASLEVYHKWTRNQVDYVDGADIFMNQYLESQLLSGIGRAYGMELYLKKNYGKFNGWLSYTLGKSELKVDGINFGDDKMNRNGNWYPTKYDQRHNLKMAAFYEAKENMLFSANFTYISGTPTTFPTDRINIQEYTIPYIGNSERNNFRIPDYHRLDVSATFKNIWRGKKGRKGEDHFVVSLYNVYSRKNPFSIFFTQGTERQSAELPTQTSAKQMSIIGSVIPGISYNFKF